MNLEEYIKNLPPELQEKARKCASIEEILALAEGEDIQLPEEVLETIAGGKKRDPRNCGKTKCPNCGSTDIKVVRNELYFMCANAMTAVLSSGRPMWYDAGETSA